MVLEINPFLQSVVDISAFEVDPKSHPYNAMDENLKSFDSSIELIDSCT